MDDIESNFDKCLLCLDTMEKEQIDYPKYCECKVKLHSNCLILMENVGLLCPICRKKNDIIKINNTNHLSILDFPFTIFNKYPNFLTFTFLMIWSFIVSILFIFPYFIYLKILNKN